MRSIVIFGKIGKREGEIKKMYRVETIAAPNPYLR